MKKNTLRGNKIGRVMYKDRLKKSVKQSVGSRRGWQTRKMKTKAEMQ